MWLQAKRNKLIKQKTLVNKNITILNSYYDIVIKLWQKEIKVVKTELDKKVKEKWMILDNSKVYQSFCITKSFLYREENTCAYQELVKEIEIKEDE